MNRIFVTLLFCSVIITFCCKNQTERLQQLQRGEGIIDVTIGGKPFYGEDNIFKGDIYVLPNVFRLNVFDQYKSNFILSFEENNGYQDKPYIKEVFKDNQVAASIMIGKLKDSVAARGEGYLITEGKINVRSINENKLELEFMGKGAKFESYNVPEKWVKIKGTVIFNRPSYKIEGIDKQSIFYAE